MKRLIVAAAFIVVLIIARMTQLADENRFSIETWKHQVGYTGDVCVVTVDAHNKPYCSNGVPYNSGTVNAYEGYTLYIECYQDKSNYACEELSN